MKPFGGLVCRGCGVHSGLRARVRVLPAGRLAKGDAAGSGALEAATRQTREVSVQLEWQQEEPIDTLMIDELLTEEDDWGYEPIVH